ncbi:MAG: hypothetical protein V1889_02865 [archaeon]
MKTEDKIKLLYDYSKTYAFAFFTAELVFAFGILSNLGKINKLSLWVLLLIMFLLFMVCFYYIIIFNKAYGKLLGKDKLCDLIK